MRDAARALGGAAMGVTAAEGGAGPAGAAEVGALCEAAVAAYDGWAGSVGVDVAVRETEDALEAAREALPGLFAREAAANGAEVGAGVGAAAPPR